VTADPVDIALASQSGFDGVFAKPFSISKLNALISQIGEPRRQSRVKSLGLA
jgi:hypothetical protein